MNNEHMQMADRFRSSNMDSVVHVDRLSPQEHHSLKVQSKTQVLLSACISDLHSTTPHEYGVSNDGAPAMRPPGGLMLY